MNETIEELERALAEAQQVAERLQAKLDQALEEQKRKALDRIVAAMNEAGIELGDIAIHLGYGIVPPKKAPRQETGTNGRKNVETPKYHNPSNHAQTWAGRAASRAGSSAIAFQRTAKNGRTASKRGTRSIPSSKPRSRGASR